MKENYKIANIRGILNGTVKENRKHFSCVRRVINGIREGGIVIQGEDVPLWHRKPEWTQKKKSDFIASVLLSCPTGVIILYEKNRRFLTIDGQERLLALWEFCNGNLRLAPSKTGDCSEVLKGVVFSPPRECVKEEGEKKRKKSYKVLDEKAQSIFLSRGLTVHFYYDLSDRQAAEWHVRCNRNG